MSAMMSPSSLSIPNFFKSGLKVIFVYSSRSSLLVIYGSDFSDMLFFQVILNFFLTFLSAVSTSNIVE